jgi:hypothetical protein
VPPFPTLSTPLLYRKTHTVVKVNLEKMLYHIRVLRG